MSDVDWPSIVIPGSYDDLYKYYGNPHAAGFEAEYLITVEHEVGGHPVHMQVHKAIAVRLHLIWAAMNAAGLTQEFKTFDGSYVVRAIRGVPKPSLHSWGLALDFNAALYPLGSLRRWPQGIIKIWEQHGFVNGQDFRGRKDAMHYQYSKPHSI